MKHDGRFFLAAHLIAAWAGHPFFFLLAYWAAMALPGFWVQTGTNEGSPFLPLFLPLLAGIVSLRWLFWFRRRGARCGYTPREAFRLFLRAHRPAFISLPVTAWLTLAPVEGNAAGFVALPLLSVLSLTVGVWIWRRLRAAGRGGGKG